MSCACLGSTNLNLNTNTCDTLVCTNTVISPVTAVSTIGPTVTATTLTLPPGISAGMLKVIIASLSNTTIVPGTGASIYLGSTLVTSLVSANNNASIELLWTGSSWIIVSDTGFTIN